AQAYAALVLARQQKAPLGALREIWSRHDQARSGLLRYLQEPGPDDRALQRRRPGQPLCRPGIRRAGAGASAKS
ncbi:hypothetical protein C7D74_33150, partial [Klebsiella pneumoniae]